MSSDLSLGVVVGSTRPGRTGPVIADWLMEQTQGRDAAYRLVDLAEVGLPLLDEPRPAASGRYSHEHTRRWAGIVAPFDGFVFVVPEYNHSFPAALKNAFDFLYAEWNHKAAGLVSYGSNGGFRAAEQLRLVLAELQVTTVRAQVAISIYDDLTDFKVMAPRDYQARNAATMLTHLERYAAALRTMRMDG